MSYKAKYEVRTIQRGIPYYSEGDDFENELYSDETIIVKIGVFDALDNAQLMKEAMELKIAEANNYMVNSFTPRVRIFKIDITEEEIE